MRSGRSRGTGRRALRHSAPVQGAVSCTSSRRSSCASERFGAIAIARSTCATRAPGSRQRSPPAQRACSGRRLLHEFPAQLVCKRVGARLRRPRFGAIAIARSTCASASSPRPVAASTGPRFTCGASSSGRNASPWRYVAMPARRLSTSAQGPQARSIAVLAGAAHHGSRMHNPRCGATRLLWHRQSRHLASIHAPLRRGGHPRPVVTALVSTASLKSCPRA